MTFTNETPGNPRSERRRAGRITCTKTVCQFGELQNLSRDGCRTLGKKPVDLPEGKTCNMSIKAMGSTLVVPVRLVSCRQRDNGLYESGFQFVGLTDDMRREIVQFARAAADNEAYRKVA